MYPNTKTLVDETHGQALWCNNTGCIQLNFANLVLSLPIEALKGFMKALYHSQALEREQPATGEIPVYIMPTPLPGLQLAFTPAEQEYLLELCQRSIRLAEALVAAN